MRLLLIILFIGAFHSAFGQIHYKHLGRKPSKKLPLYTTLYSNDSIPIADAKVELIQCNEVVTTTTTDHQGKIQMADVSTGNYKLRITYQNKIYETGELPHDDLTYLDLLCLDPIKGLRYGYSEITSCGWGTWDWWYFGDSRATKTTLDYEDLR